MRLLLEIGNLSVFLGLQSIRDGVFDVLFSIPINSQHGTLLCESLQTEAGVAGFANLLARSPSELTLPVAPTQSLNGFEFANCTQQLYLLQVG